MAVNTNITYYFLLLTSYLLLITYYLLLSPHNHLNSKYPLSTEKLASYLARLGLDEGWLFIFDRRKNALPIEEGLSTEVVNIENQRDITMIIEGVIRSSPF